MNVQIGMTSICWIASYGYHVEAKKRERLKKEIRDYFERALKNFE